MCRRRRLARIAERGFTLAELMVIVVLVGILATLAVPTMSRSRDERTIFDYARKIAGIVGRARTRAAGRGSPHMVTIEGGAGGRGIVALFEGTDGVDPGPNAPPAPDRNRGCRIHDWSWTYSGFAPGTTDPAWNSEPIEGINLNQSAVGGINLANDVVASFKVFNAPATAVAICYTPGGLVYVGTGGSVSAAITNATTGVVVAAPFTDVVEITVVRKVAGVASGTRRRVIIPSSSAPRLKSE